MRHLLSVVACLLLAACAIPPPSDYTGGGAGGQGGIALGRDVTDDACVQFATGATNAEIYCGGWTEPAASVASAGPAPASLEALALTGPWREQLDQRFACGAPAATTILDGAPALVLRCTRRVGGWPQIAMVAAMGGHAYEADGITATLLVMQRGIGVLSGMAPRAAAALPPSAADSLLAGVLAARAFSAGDMAQYQRLMTVGAHANLAENFAASETAYRAALALQQRLLGSDDPNTVEPLMHLALQISNQGRFREAAALFRRAAVLAPLATDPTAPARLLHYRALDALNQGHDAAALALLRRASAGYAALLPAGTLATASGVPASSAFAAHGSVGMLPDVALAGDPTAQTALLGLIETWRYQAVAQRGLHDLPAADAAIARAQALARGTGMDVPLVTARLTRTAAVTDEAQGRLVPAEAGLAQATVGFDQLLPETRPIAETELLQAADALRRGQPARVLGLCRSAAGLLRQLQVGIDPDLLTPCLTAFDTAAAQDPAHRQALLAEMFETAELGQDSVTSREIAEAAARLAEHARDPRVAQAIRRRQDAASALGTLYRQRDALARGPSSGTEPAGTLPQNPAALDAAIARAQADLADASAALQAAAPNYRQLVQVVVPASAVLAALQPREAFVAIDLTDHGGWTFLLRDGQIDAAPLAAGTEQVGKLVHAIRATIEPDDNGKLPAYDVAAALALYRDVLGPVAPRLKDASDFVVAPSGPLLALPFAILLTGPARPDSLATAPWLIRQFPIAYVPAAANFVALRKLVGGPQAPRPWFGFGDPVPVSLAQARQSFPVGACADSAQLFAGLPPLPFAERELTAARELLGGSPADQLVGHAYTTTAVARVDLKRFRVLHFATHALLPAELRCQSQPAIVTSAPAGANSANGALLTSGEVLGLDLNANTVILSACNSYLLIPRSGRARLIGSAGT